MANLISPGVDISVVDQTQFTSAPQGTVPFILIATAQNKVNQSNTLAQYTTANTAGQIYLETSQRSLVQDFGAPIFENVQGTPVNGSEQNEYGLMTAFSTLGVSSAAYIMRAPIDLAALSGSLTAPVGTPPNDTLWLDTTATDWGLFEFDAATLTFFPIVSTNQTGDGKLWVLDSSVQTNGNIGSLTAYLGANCQPSSSIGKPGDYAVVPANASNPVWFQNSSGTWVLVGSQAWQDSVPTVIGANTYPIVTGNIILNGSNVNFTANSLSSIVSGINAANITGVNAVIVSNRLALTVDYLANSGNGNVVVTGDVSVLGNVGISAATYYAPAYQASPFTNVPQWNPTDATPEPTGSIWFNTTPQQEGANIVIREFNSASNVWTVEPVVISENDATVNTLLDPIGGGINIPAGTLYFEYGAFGANAASILWERVAGATIITGTAVSANVTASSTFVINTATVGSNTFTANVTITIPSVLPTDFVAAVNSASIPGITAGLNRFNQIYIENTTGETFYLYEGTYSPLTTVGILTSPALSAKVSNWVTPTYVVSAITPTADPANDTIWYYDDPTVADILVNTGNAWMSYRTVTADARGYNLSLTDVNGPIASASMPLTQSNGNVLAYGDIWLNTADLNSLPSIYRYSTGNTWVQINNADHTSSNGIVFADARWSAGFNDILEEQALEIVISAENNYNIITENSTYALLDPGLGILEPISLMLVASPANLDPDAPSYALYPRGTLLFNTRRSGMNVKQFMANYFTVSSNVPYSDTWVTLSGNNELGVAYQGSAAQRNVVVKSLISALENSYQIQDEFYNFNLMSCPGYPEVLPALVTIDEARGETAFIVSDSPLTLQANANALNTWANNLNQSTTDDVNGLVTFYDYAATYYPSGLTTDLTGNNIVVPSSFMALPTIIQSDAVSYPWFAPAGARRGLVTNVSSIGYVDEQTGNFITNSISKALRDVLYPAYVNPISNFQAGGIQIYGQKTRSGQDTELSRINVARLVIYLRGALNQIGGQYVFEQNDSITRQGIAYQIGEFLKSIQALRGITDYAVVCDLSNNSPATIDANELFVDVAVAPTTVAEYIYIPITLVGQGVITTSSVTAG
jgi:hypothetical protein